MAAVSADQIIITLSYGLKLSGGASSFAVFQKAGAKDGKYGLIDWQVVDALWHCQTKIFPEKLDGSFHVYCTPYQCMWRARDMSLKLLLNHLFFESFRPFFAPIAGSGGGTRVLI